MDLQTNVPTLAAALMARATGLHHSNQYSRGPLVPSFLPAAQASLERGVRPEGTSKGTLQLLGSAAPASGSCISTVQSSLERATAPAASAMIRWPPAADPDISNLHRMQGHRLNFALTQQFDATHTPTVHEWRRAPSVHATTWLCCQQIALNTEPCGICGRVLANAESETSAQACHGGGAHECAPHSIWSRAGGAVRSRAPTK